MQPRVAGATQWLSVWKVNKWSVVELDQSEACKVSGLVGVRGLLSAKVPNSSFPEAHSVLLTEPTTWKMKIRRMKRKVRETVKSAKWRVEENQNNHCT